MAYTRNSVRGQPPEASPYQGIAQTAHHLNLPYLQATNGSASSLLDAVVGQPSHPTAQPTFARPVLPSPAVAQQQTSSHASRDTANSAASSQSHGDGSLVRTSERGESDWDVLSDASARVNEGGNVDGQDEEVVKDLQDKVAKRRSQLPRLESQLADLEAQIKAAEERLARAQTIGVEKGVVTKGAGGVGQFRQ